jgi:hypothetical protein
MEKFKPAIEAKEKEISDWAARRIQACQKHLVNLGDFFNRSVLAHNSAPQRCIEFLRVAGAPGRIKHCIQSGSHSFHTVTCLLHSLLPGAGLRSWNESVCNAEIQPGKPTGFSGVRGFASEISRFILNTHHPCRLDAKRRKRN